MISLTRIKKPKVRADLPLALRYSLVSGLVPLWGRS
jgi:hypothetical protein